jgi:predicted metal-binding protein
MKKATDLERLFVKRGFKDFRWLDPREIVVGQWVRMKCLYGCVEYGHNACCPPNAPSVEDCERFFRDYQRAAVFHFRKAVAKPEDRHAWSRRVNLGLLKLEREVFLSGHVKAFLLPMDSCSLCQECSGIRMTCKKPKLARPTADAMAMDVYATVRKLGYPIQVLSDTKQAMNRYAFLFIE